MRNPTLNYDFSWIWSLKTLNKIKFFLWLCSHNKLPCKTYLNRSCLPIDINCSTCHHVIKSPTHFFFDCSITKNFCLDLGLNLHFISSHHEHWLQIINKLNIPLPIKHINWAEFYPFALWHIWITRNHTTFNHSNIPLKLYIISLRAQEYKFSTYINGETTTYKEINIKWYKPP